MTNQHLILNIFILFLIIIFKFLEHKKSYLFSMLIIIID
jgi:hypothetical protein